VEPVPLELVVLTFADASADSARALAERAHARGQVRVVSALVLRQEPDGSPTAVEWTDADDVFDLAADLTARRIAGLDGAAPADVVRDLEPGTTVLVLLLEHLWARSLHRDIADLGGHCLASAALPAERIRDVERLIARGDG
jgi:hypothetical protein